MLLKRAWPMIMMTIRPLMMMNKDSLKKDDDHQQCSKACLGKR